MTQKNSTTMTASYRIVTPMFCSGADQNKAELRLPSFKGALRFWWRSLMWGTGDGRTTDVAQLHRQEAELFGASDQSVGQSKVRMRMIDEQIQPQPDAAQWANGKGIQYLGFGVMNYKGQLTRPMIPGGQFTVQLRLAPGLDQQQRLQVHNALILLGSLGGLGSKSRKGFGSLALTHLIENGESVELDSDPIERIRSAVGTGHDGQPEWTAWSSHSRVIKVTDAGRRPVEVLDQLGREQVYYRSWGNRGRVIDRDSEPNFPEDHDLSKGQRPDIQHPKRIVFGLPHNYGKGDSNAVSPANRDLDRRASPLFLHVHQAGENEIPVGVVAILPARFLPDGEKIRAFGNDVPLETGNDFWQPLHGFLDRLLAKPGATQKQTDLNATEVNLG